MNSADFPDITVDDIIARVAGAIAHAVSMWPEGVPRDRLIAELYDQARRVKAAERPAEQAPHADQQRFGDAEAKRRRLEYLSGASSKPQTITVAASVWKPPDTPKMFRIKYKGDDEG